MEAGAGGAVVSASTGARTASAQGWPGRCWMGTCFSCSLSQLCSPASLGQVQPHSCPSCSLNPSLMGPCPLGVAPQQPRTEAGGGLCWEIVICSERGWFILGMVVQVWVVLGLLPLLRICGV